MDEKKIQHEYVMKLLCSDELQGGLGYKETPSNVVTPDLFVLPDLADFIKKSDEQQWARLVKQFKGNEQALLHELKDVIKAKLMGSKNVATFFNTNKTIGFKGETIQLFFDSGSVLRGDEDFKKNIFSAVEESSHTMMLHGKKVNTIRPDITFFLNGIFIGYMELKTVSMGQNARDHGRRKIAKDYLSTIKGIVECKKSGPVYKKEIPKVTAIFEKAIHLTASDLQDTFIIRNISNFFHMAMQKFSTEPPQTVDDIIGEVIEQIKEYPLTSPSLNEHQRFEEVMKALYSKRMIEKEILYYNFIEYKYVKKDGKKERVTNRGHLITPRPKQKFGCDKIMGRISEMLTHEKEPDYYINKLRGELKEIGVPQAKIEEIIKSREKFQNNKFVYSLLMQYAAGFGKSNIIGWLALQLKDYRYDNDYAYNKILLVVDRLQLRDQLDTMMRNMNIDKSMFVEAVDSDTFIKALAEKQRIIVVNIQKFLDMQDAIDRSKYTLKKMRVAFLIDEIHRSNSGDENAEMIDIFAKLQEHLSVGDKVIEKKNLLIGFTATPSEETLTRFGEFHSAYTYPFWTPFDSYSMQEAIDDGYILNPTKHIIPFTVPVGFELPPELEEIDDDILISENKQKVYAFEPRMRKIAEFIVERLVSLVYGKICVPGQGGQGKAMLAVSSIPIAIKYCNIIRQMYKEKCQDPKYAKFKDAPICIVYSDSQGQEKCSSLNNDKSEEAVIQYFKNEKNGLIIVVDKLQTGFDEPNLHTLFLDKEITGINAIQTISRVNRTCKYKEECHIVDLSWHNVNTANIKAAFKKYCNMTTSEFNPEQEAQNVALWYQGLMESHVYRAWFSQYQHQREDAEFIVTMEDGITRWIIACFGNEELAKEYNKKHELKPSDPDYQSEENPARDLRTLIGRYGSAIMDLKGVFIIDEKYYDEVFLSFWQKYCNIYSKLAKKNEKRYEFEVVDSDELPGITMVDDDDDDDGEGGTGGGGGGPASSTPKGKTIDEVLAILKRMNDEEQLTAQQALIWLKEIGLMFQTMQKDEDFITYIKDPNFTDEQKLEYYVKLQNRYRRRRKNEPDFVLGDKFKPMLDENKEQLFDIFMRNYRHVEQEESDFDFDTKDNAATDESFAGMTWKQMVEHVMQKVRPSYNEALLKEALVDQFSSRFAGLSNRMRSMDEIVNNMIMILNTQSTDQFDGVDEILKDALNNVCRAENIRPTEKRMYLTTLLIKYETFLKKLYYLINKTDVPARETGKTATLSNAIFAFDFLRELHDTEDPELQAFNARLQMVRDLRNTESHGTITINEDQVDAAIRCCIDMYLFAVANSITELEKEGYYPEPIEEATVINMTSDAEDIHIDMAAEPRG